MTAPVRLTLRQLQIFGAVAEVGSTSAAAETLALSQSATSAAVNELERLLEVRLFDRVGKRLLLNDNGRALLPRSLLVLDSARSIELWARDRSSQVGMLRVGASTTIGNYLLPSLLSEFRRSLPDSVRQNWNVQVTIGNTSAITEQVGDFRLDVGLIEGPCHQPTLVVQPWLQDELALVCAPQDPLLASGGRRISLAALRNATWLLREKGSGTREIVEQLLVPHLHHLRAGIEFSNSEAIKHAAASGLGITCLSRYVVQDLLKLGALTVLPTELPPLTRSFYLVTHVEKQKTRGLELLLAHLERATRKNQSVGARASSQRPKKWRGLRSGV
jgi:DNA-binding transcriptional LysR family regulator